MAKFSACKPMFRAYTNNALETTSLKQTSHTIGKMVKVDVDPQFKEGTIYGDDAVAESKRVFNFANIALETTDFPTTALEDVLGVAKTTSSAKDTYKFKDDTESNYGKFGYIFGKVVNGTNSYTVDVYPRVIFDLPKDSISTAGENIEFATESITGKAYADATGEWRIRTEYPSLATAKTALESAIGGTISTASVGGGETIPAEENEEGT